MASPWQPNYGPLFEKLLSHLNDVWEDLGFNFKLKKLFDIFLQQKNVNNRLLCIQSETGCQKEFFAYLTRAPILDFAVNFF